MEQLTNDALREHAKQINDATAALIELEAMKAENAYCELHGHSRAYSEDNFMELLQRYGLGHNENIEKYRRF